jgi:nucleotide-binding universal stress UspA family protein
MEDGKVGSSGHEAMGTILVAIDFSEASLNALRFGDRFARMSGVGFAVCHVIPSMTQVNPLFPQASLPDPSALEAEEEAVTSQVAEVVAARTGRSAGSYDLLVTRGSPAAEIVRTAEAIGAGAVVIANRGTSGLVRMLVGSVSESVVRHAHCTVVVVR